MVSASELKAPKSKEIIQFVIAGVIALAIIFGIGLAVYSLISGTKNNSKAAKPFKASDELNSQINNLKFPVSQPAAVPQNFVRTNVEIIKSSTTKTKCEEVLQNYQVTIDLKKDYIDIYSAATGCNFPIPDDAQTYSVGDYSGWISDPKPTGGYALSNLIELTVREGIVRIETDLSKDQIEPVLKKFVAYNSVPPEDSITLKDG